VLKKTRFISGFDMSQALIRAELNSAKGAMYDELRVKAERSEAECQRLMVSFSLVS